jgi:hypothetical protein
MEDITYINSLYIYNILWFINQLYEVRGTTLLIPFGYLRVCELEAMAHRNRWFKMIYCFFKE